ncbi:MAG: response regulator transcription factor [Anaerolineales bacterium]|jgi:DNA-binding response OmpR family regulator
MSKKDLVLVIDDDLETLRLLKMALERANFSVLTAANWEDVFDRVQLTYANNSPIDVVVLDLMMPGRSGFDIYRSLQRELVTMPPVIMLTAVTGMQQRIDARDLGVTKYLTKPTTPSKLVETLKEVLRESRLNKPNQKPIDKFPPKRFDG